MPDRTQGRWTNHGTIKDVYSSWWVTLTIDEVEKPDGSIVEHEVIVGPDATTMAVLNEERGLLMIWRHRFMPDSWGWEIPGGAVDEGEDAETAARRECLEETGWEVSGPAEHLSRHHPSCGLLRQTFDIFMASDAKYTGVPADVNEAAFVEWRTLPQVAQDMRNGNITDGHTQLAVALAFIRSGASHLLAPQRTKSDG